eukprot:10458629-Alexandrium_andersonii.AAC.1
MTATACPLAGPAWTLLRSPKSPGHAAHLHRSGAQASPCMGMACWGWRTQRPRSDCAWGGTD